MFQTFGVAAQLLNSALQHCRAPIYPTSGHMDMLIAFNDTAVSG
jgi:hypothetical protein